MTNDNYPYNLGSFGRIVTTQNKTTQTWFDRGLVWAYAFNHEESATCFELAIESDPNCAMAYWGLAYCIGPNYNKPWSFFDDKDLAMVVRRGHDTAKMAQAHSNTATPIEQALIRAIQFRYADDRSLDKCSSWDKGFADAMGEVYAKFPNDIDVVTIYADALMNLNPWNLWDLKSGKPVEGARTLEIKKLLDQALTLDGALQHPGLLHMYIHLMEMSPCPESALPVADHLRGLVPDGGHLHHMPTHLDVLCGRYHEAIASNAAASTADEKFLANAGAENFYTLYRAHDYHFSVYAAMFCGRSQVAFDAVSRLESTIPMSLLLLQSPPMADWLEAFLSLRSHVLIRFGRWQELIALPLPEAQDLYCMTTAMLHYAKGVAYAATGRVTEAENQRSAFRCAVQRVPISRTLFNNRCLDILKIAESMLDGELEYRKGNVELAFERLQRSIYLEDHLPYDEPWGWMQPTRHAYGALLLEQGQAEKALSIYMADLGMTDDLPRALQHPNNIWALHGVHECLLKIGRSRAAEDVKGKLTAAVAAADVPIYASCFCRLEEGESCGDN